MSDKAEKNHCTCGRFTRRSFIKSVGAGAGGAVVAGALGAYNADAEDDAGTIPAGESIKITLDINGKAYTAVVESRWTLLFVLREKLGLTGAKPGCERGECGSCTVLINDQPRYACLTLAVEAVGKRIETVEGLLQGERLGPVQEAFVEEDAYQCGYCTPGQIMAAEGLLRAQGDPDLETVRTAMSGNLCRCGTYEHISKAVLNAAKRKGGAS